MYIHRMGSVFGLHSSYDAEQQEDRFARLERRVLELEQNVFLNMGVRTRNMMFGNHLVPDHPITYNNNPLNTPLTDSNAIAPLGSGSLISGTPPQMSWS
jgi:hypothetical protein